MDIERGKKLLLVEDETIISMITVKMLKRSGYEVITVNSGKKAVETALNDTSIDLILMDIDLGSGINGTEAARQILQIRHIPIVFLTSHSEQSVVEMVKEITRYGYVIKNSGDFVLLSSIDMAFELFDSNERLKASAEYLRLSEERVRSKLDSILSPEGDIGILEFNDIVDTRMLQSILDDFNTMTGISVGIVDNKGRIIASTGYNGLCTNFYRSNTKTLRNCIESNTLDAEGITPGTYKLVKCRNNLWEMATPIEIGGKIAGNLFLGQFMFDDDVIDYDFFRSQARKFGFNEVEFIKAIESIPRYGRDEIFTAMTFYIKLLNIISKLSYSNIKLAKTLAERDRYSNLHKESEERLSDVTEYMADLVARLDTDGFYKYVSPSYERVLGYRQEELVGTWAGEIVHPADRDQNVKDITSMCDKGEGSVELRQRHKNGSFRWFDVTGRNISDENGIVTGAVLGARDITERKIAEKELDKKNKKYKGLFETMIDGFALHEIIVDDWGNPVDYVFLEVNPAFEKHTGLAAESIVGKRVTEIIPDIEPDWIAAYGQVAFTGVQRTFENYSARINKWFKVTAYSPDRGYFASIFEDITDRRKAEELLKERDERYKRLFESVVGYIYTVFIDNKIPVKTVHGPGCEAVTGYTPEDFISDPELWYNMIYPDDRGRVVLFASDIMNRGVFSPIEHRIICSDGSMSWVRNTPVPHYDLNKNLIEYDSVIADITDRKIAEIALKDSEARYRIIVEKNPGLLLLLRNGKYIFSNIAGAEVLGYKSPADIIGIELGNTISPEDMLEIKKREERAMAGEENPPIELKFIRPDGTLCLTESASFPINLPDGPAVLVMGQNITEKRQLENMIAADLEKYRMVADFTYDWEFWVGPDGSMIYCSPSCERITGYASDDFVKDPFLLRRIVFPEDRGSPCVEEKEVHQFPEENETEFRITRRDGSVKWIGNVCCAVYDHAGNFAGRRGSNRDITKNKKSFETINSLLKEKELLLSEVHHRIKNNMNTISGLLMLQAESMSNEAAITALNDARSRVQGMMLMYDKLYRSEDYRKMNVKEYFEKFIDEIFMIFENSNQVTIIKDIDDFILETKTIFPVGIAINELITNAFKYAFPHGRNGIIKVSIKKVKDKVTLSISDDGAGLPDEVIASRSGGFGLNLVSALTEQIGGVVKISKNNGTIVEIVFSVGG